MQGKDAYNPDAGYPALPQQDGTPNPPPYTDYPQPAYPHPQGNPGYPPQGSGYPHPPGPVNPPPTVGYPQPGTQIHVQLPGPAIVIQSIVGPEPTRTTCRSCNNEMVTRIDRKSTMKTHLMALLLCVFGCWPCVCVPYCMDSCLDTDHYCSKCGAFVGSYAR